MLRTLLFLLLVAVCSGLVYELSVDPKNGQDVTACQTSTVIANTISPNVSCRSIAYALKGGISTNDVLSLTLYPGNYTGADNTNQAFSFQQFDIYGNDTSGTPKAIIDCNFISSESGFQITPRIGNIYYTINNVAFYNCQGGTGGAISIGTGPGGVKINNCAFVNNKATVNGGAIYSKSTNLIVNSCIFSNNSAANLGGAMYVESQDLTVTGSTFYMNSASSGAAIYGSDIGANGDIMYFQSNNFTNNTAAVKGGAFFADNTATGSRTYDFTGSEFDNNCATSSYTDSYDVQVRCAGNCTIQNKGNFTGCTDIEKNIPPADSSDDHKKSSKDKAIIIGVVVPFGILIILSIALFLYIRKRHNAEMAKRDDYRKKILKALENLPPEEQEAARLEAENADPSAPKCQLCQQRPISSPLPCGHEIVCSVCRTILLECPVKGCKKATR